MVQIYHLVGRIIFFFNDNRWVVASEASAFQTGVDPCSEGGLTYLKEKVYQIARERLPEGAWRLVQTLLCGKGEKATKFIFNHIQMQTSNNSIERPDYHNIYATWPPYSEDPGNEVVPISKSKNSNSQDFEDLLLKGKAYNVFVSPVNIAYKIDEAHKRYVYKNYIYTDVISLDTETGRNNGKLGWTYYIFFENDRWVIIGLNPIID